MRCSLSFVLAALAATGSATTNKVSRDLGHERFVRRSPVEKHIDAKSEINAKCYGPDLTCQSIGNSQVATQFQSFQSISVTSIQQNQGILPFPGGNCFSGMNSWGAASGGIASFTNAMSAYGAFVTQQQVQISTFINSFANLCQIISVFVQQFQSLGQFGGGNPQLAVQFFQLIVSIQGFLGYATAQFGFSNFCQMAGNSWTLFVSQMTIIFRFAQTCGFFQDPNVCIGQGFNMNLWDQQYGFHMSSMFSVQQYSSSVANLGTFSINSGGGGGAFSMGGIKTFDQRTFFQQNTQFSSSSSITSGGRSYIGGGGGGGGSSCYPNCPDECDHDCDGDDDHHHGIIPDGVGLPLPLKDVTGLDFGGLGGSESRKEGGALSIAKNLLRN